MEQTFLRTLSPESRYSRFMGTLRELTPQMLKRFTQIDYDREMAYVATVRKENSEIQIGVCRYIAIPGSARCEFALTIADTWHRRGLGTHMMILLMKYARSCGIRYMFGEIQASNHGMLSLCAKLGFSITESVDGPTVKRADIFLANP